MISLKISCFKLLRKSQVEEMVRDRVSGSNVDVAFNKITAKVFHHGIKSM
jgi:hypothetical protein